MLGIYLFEYSFFDENPAVPNNQQTFVHVKVKGNFYNKIENHDNKQNFDHFAVWGHFINDVQEKN